MSVNKSYRGKYDWPEYDIVYRRSNCDVPMKGTVIVVCCVSDAKITSLHFIGTPSCALTLHSPVSTVHPLQPKIIIIIHEIELKLKLSANIVSLFFFVFVFFLICSSYIPPYLCAVFLYISQYYLLCWINEHWYTAREWEWVWRHPLLLWNEHVACAL